MKFGTDGVRGRAGEVVTSGLACSLGRALASLGASEVLIARDTRESGPMLEAALAAGLLSGGARPLSLGVLPTPALSAILRRHPLLHAGVMITASHNPPEDNGLKLFGPMGNKMEREALQRIENSWIPHAVVPSFSPLPSSDFLAEYLHSFQSAFGHSLEGLHLLVDCANGAAVTTAAPLLAALGAQAECLNTQGGSAINVGCGSLYPHVLAEQVVARGADYGIALDGDGDRGILILGDGRVVDGDDLLWLAAFGAQKGTTVVGTIMSNSGLEHALRAKGILFVRTPVGDAYVAEAIYKHASPLPALPYYQFRALGGEPSGHLILSPWLPTADGLFAALQGIHALQTGASLNWPRRPQIHRTQRFSGPVPPFDLSAEIAALEAEGAYVVVRPSGTEPLIRIMVEHPEVAFATR